MLDSAGGAAQAVENVRALVRGGQDTGMMLLFFLHRLKQERPGGLAPMLAEVLAAEGRKPDAVAVVNLYRVAGFYLHEDVPPELRTRFLELAVKVTRGGAEWQDRKLTWDGYNLLRAAAPALQRQRHPLFAQASAQLAALTTRVPRPDVEREEAEERIRRSADPLGETIKEGDAAKDSSFRERLLADAARLALKQGELKLAVDLIIRAKPEGDEFAYGDQFLGEVVAKAVGQKDAGVAFLAASKIGAPLKRASAMVRVGFHLYEEEDLPGAREALGEALKLIKGAGDDAAKVTALLQIIPAYAKVDDARLPELSAAAVKIINNVPAPNPAEKPGSEARKKYVSELLQIAYNVIPTFRSLAERDEAGTLGLADSIRPREIKAAAHFGVLTNRRTSDAGAVSAAHSK